MSKKNKYIIFTSLYNETNPKRIDEYLFCLNKNINHPLVGGVVVFYDGHKDADKKENNIIKNYLNAHGIKIVDVKQRPTFEYLFQYANNNYPRSRIIIANGDIYFNDTLCLVDKFDLENSMLALTRWNLFNGFLSFFSQKIQTYIARCQICGAKEPIVNKELVRGKNYHPKLWGKKADACIGSVRNSIDISLGRIVDYSGYSQDAWVFNTPFLINYRCDYELGTFHSDSLLNFNILQSSLYIYNPSLDVQACHVHSSNIKSADDLRLIKNKSRILFKENYYGSDVAGITPMKIDDCARLRKKKLRLNHNILNPISLSSGPGISVFCAVKDRNQNLEESIKNWLTFPEISEIIIVDWDSSEKVLPLVGKYQDGRINLFRIDDQPDWVLSKAFNLAARLTTRDIILKLDADITLSQGFFKKYKLSPGSFIAGNWQRATKKEDRHIGGTFCVHRKDFFKVNGFNENILTYGWDDEDLYSRFNSLGLKRYDFENGDVQHKEHSDAMRIRFQPEVNDPISEIYLNRDKFIFDKKWSSNGKVAEFALESVDYKRKYGKFIEVKRQSLLKPKISVITSVFKGARYIDGFLRNIVEQTIFNQCELILVDANSPDNEDDVIKKYQRKYKNIIYKRLDFDPGLYAVWNIAIRMSSGEYLTNANLDDRRSPSHLEELCKVLDNEKEISVVSSALGVSDTLDEYDFRSSYQTRWFMDKKYPQYYGKSLLYTHDKFGKIRSQNIPHCMPLWRRNLHTKYGFFDEKIFSPHSDWEFWLRCAEGGEKFKLVKSVLGMYFFNPHSFDRRFPEKERVILDMIKKRYGLSDTKIQLDKLANKSNIICL